MNIIPIVMIKNEEIWIGRVLKSLTNVFQYVVVADTGSTDTTVDEVKKVGDKIKLIQYNNTTPEQVGIIRQLMQEYAASFGATHVMLVDGDELYPTTYLKYIYDNPMPDNSPCGFTYGVECGELDNGELVMYGAHKSRDAIFSVNSKWSGVYPFEGHTCYNENPPLNYYWPCINPVHKFYHLHACRRSSKDSDVHMRLRKQHQFNMREDSNSFPKTPWLKSESDYEDE